VELEHEYRGDISMVLVSPAGTRSNILSHRRLDNSSDGIDFTFMTVHHWGEDPAGTWTLEVKDHSRDGSPSSNTENGAASSHHRRGHLRTWSLVLYGVAGERPNHHGTENTNDATHQSPLTASEDTDSSEQARLVGSSEVKELMEKEAESSDAVQIHSKDEMAVKQNKRRRKWLQERGFRRDDIDFLIALFETEEKWKSAKDSSVTQKRSEISSSRGNRHYSGSSKSQNNWWRGNYDARWQQSPSKQSVEGNHVRIVDQDAVNGSTNVETLRELIDELSAILDDD